MYAHPFYLLSSILFHEHTRVCLSISRLVDIWVIFRFCLLEIKLQRTSVYTFLFRHRLSFLLGRHLGMEWLDHMVGYVFNFLRNCQLFSNVGSSNSSSLLGPSFPTCETKQSFRAFPGMDTPCPPPPVCKKALAS